jgi:hypothetical protein
LKVNEQLFHRVMLMHRVPLLAIAFCLVAASAGSSDDRPQSTEKPATTQASGIAAEFKAIKQEADAKPNKLYAAVAGRLFMFWTTKA